jgi:hypothetical protein
VVIARKAAMVIVMAGLRLAVVIARKAAMVIVMAGLRLAVVVAGKTAVIVVMTGLRLAVIVAGKAAMIAGLGLTAGAAGETAVASETAGLLVGGGVGERSGHVYKGICGNGLGAIKINIRGARRGGYCYKSRRYKKYLVLHVWFVLLLVCLAAALSNSLSFYTKVYTIRTLCPRVRGPGVPSF